MLDYWRYFRRFFETDFGLFYQRRSTWLAFLRVECFLSVFLGSVQTEKVTCIGAPAGREWERPRMVLSGHSDGSIRVWARELVPCRNSRYFDALYRNYLFNF